jgi:hypothetical protein
MTDLVRLRAPKGTDEANIGINRYTVHEDGFFYIPRFEYIDGMLRVGGFTVAVDQSQTVATSASAASAGKSPAEIAALISELERIEAEPTATPRAPMRLTIPA